MLYTKLKTLCQLIFMINVASFGGIRCGNLPAEVSKCSAGDTICIAKTINEILRRYPKGNSQFGLGAVDAIPIRDLVVARAEGDSPVQFNLKFNSLIAHGIEQAIIERVVGFDKDPTKSKFEVYAVVPKFSLIGDYELNGKLLLLPIEGKGQANLALKNLKFAVRCMVDVQLRNDKKYLHVKKCDTKVQTEDLKVEFENLFNGNKELGDSINKVINESWRDIWSEIQNGIDDAVGGVVKKLTNKVTQHLSYDDFFKKD